MVINYKMLNDNTKWDKYFIPNKEVLFNRIQVPPASQRESIPLTAFSDLQGHY